MEIEIKRFGINNLTPRTCVVNSAKEGFACNKTVFLLQDSRQLNDAEIETWTAMHYKKDRFGLINGLMYLIKKSINDQIRVFFSESESYKTSYFIFNKSLSYSEISMLIDMLYYIPDTVEYRWKM